MPINPGSRYPEPTKTQRAASVVRSNAVTVAYTLGMIVGIILTLVAGAVR